MQHILITGANRGIGLELVRQYLKHDDTMVFAACRNPGSADDLNQLAEQHGERLAIVALEVTDEGSIAESVSQVSAKTDKLDILINNAGINPPGQAFGQMSAGLMLSVLNVNVVGPFMVTQAYFDLLKASDNPRVANISSGMGSIGERTYNGNHAYGASKAGVNMVSRGLEIALKGSNITVIALDPGWVRTDMGGPSANLSTEESATGILKVIDNLSLDDSGSYLIYDGGSHPW